MLALPFFVNWRWSRDSHPIGIFTGLRTDVSPITPAAASVDEAMCTEAIINVKTRVTSRILKTQLLQRNRAIFRTICNHRSAADFHASLTVPKTPVLIMQ